MSCGHSSRRTGIQERMHRVSSDAGKHRADHVIGVHFFLGDFFFRASKKEVTRHEGETKY
ncbi:MAG: hypothetical protein HY356_02320 [Gammaproteobacteria bacterium]|nr:hypothetical protein [Gammaproteobacteria bacterium]